MSPGFYICSVDLKGLISCLSVVLEFKDARQYLKGGGGGKRSRHVLFSIETGRTIRYTAAFNSHLTKFCNIHTSYLAVLQVSLKINFRISNLPVV